MFQQNQEQASNVRFNLQFFAEPGGEPTSPPVQESIPSVSNVQAPTAPTNTEPKTVDWETHQAAIRGMNDAQRSAAEWNKIAKENGFNSPQEALQAFQGYKNYQQLQSNPIPAITDLLRQNPMQAAQIFGQVFNNQQPQVDPYENVNTYQDLAQVLEQQLVGKLKNELTPMIQPIQQYQQQQRDSGIRANVDQQIGEFIKNNTDFNLTPEAVWNVINSKKIPLEVLAIEPDFVQTAIISAVGGLGKYAETVGKRQVTNYQKEVLSNARGTATVSPNGGQVVNEIKEPIQNEEQLKRAAHEMFAAIRTGQT